MEGRSVAPSGIIRRGGGERDTVDWGVGKTLCIAESIGRARNFGPCPVIRGRDAPSTLRNVPSGGEKRRGEQETGIWGSLGSPETRGAGEFSRVHLARRALRCPLQNDLLEEAKETR